MILFVDRLISISHHLQKTFRSRHLFDFMSDIHKALQVIPLLIFHAKQ